MAQNNGQAKFFAPIKVISLATIFIFLIAAQCCTVAPVPMVSDPAAWSTRMRATDSALVADKSTLLNLQLTAQYNFDEYRFKVGADSSTNCSQDSGYTPWTAKTTRLQADISAVPDGKVKLCILGRGRNNCGNLITQSPIAASFYRWRKDTTGPGAFSITGPSTPQTSTSFVATWGAASDAASYTASVHSATGCQSASMLSQYSGSATSANVTVPSAGTYYLCGSAADAVGNKTSATNNGFQVVVQGQETIVEDRITDQSCWANGAGDIRYLHYLRNVPVHPSIASVFTGNGQSLSKVSVLISSRNWEGTNCNHVNWPELQYCIDVWPSVAQYVANPNDQTNVVLGQCFAEPSNNQVGTGDYYQFPVGQDQNGCAIYRVEFDFADKQISYQTTAGAQHVLALRPAFGDSYGGFTYTYLGKNACQGGVGNDSDYAVTTQTALNGAAVSLPDRGAAQSHGVYRISTK